MIFKSHRENWISSSHLSVSGGLLDLWQRKRMIVSLYATLDPIWHNTNNRNKLVYWPGRGMLNIDTTSSIYNILEFQEGLGVYKISWKMISRCNICTYVYLHKSVCRTTIVCLIHVMPQRSISCSRSTDPWSFQKLLKK